jgi:hypothetical protein
MCEECEEAEPLYVAYFGKAGGNVWRPPQAAASEPRYRDQSDVPVPQPRFVCDDADRGQDRALIYRKLI